MALCGASLAKDEFNAARMIARPVFPASAFVATRLMVVAVLQGTEAEDWQEIPASAGLPKLSEFMVYFDATDEPEKPFGASPCQYCPRYLCVLGQ
jgi:hypothetical protein